MIIDDNFSIDDNIDEIKEIKENIFDSHMLI